jgi:hypothetical protein
VVTVQIDGSRTLAEALGDEWSEADSIVVRGHLSLDDIATLGRCCDKGRLTGIDMSGAWLDNDSLPAFAFRGQYKLRAVTLPDNLRIVGEYAFSQCLALEWIVLPASVMKLGDCCFWCNAFTSLHWPSGLEHIGIGALESARFRSIYLPEGVRFIGEVAFKDNQRLSDVVLPASLQEYNSSMFQNCIALERVYCKSAVPPLNVQGKIIDNGLDSDLRAVRRAVLIVPRGSASAYRTSDYWKEFGSIEETDAFPADEEALGIVAPGGCMTPDLRAVYRLDGSRVNGMQEPGMYIVNGRKVLRR